MKKIFTLVVGLSLISSLTASAQVFRFGTGMGVQLGSNQESAGISLNLLEFALAPKPAYEVGLYLGMNTNASAKGDNVSGDVNARYGLQGRYYFRETGFKPYAGLQLGLGTGGNFTANTTNSTVSDVDAKTKFQAVPMAGFRVGPLNVYASYNKGVMLNGGLLFGVGRFK